jgi:oligopeptide transport system ATP-binding protein
VTNEKQALLTVKNLEIAFGAGKRRFVAVKDANFDLYPGETLALVGESGSGKTTIGRAILGIIPTAAGTITFHGQPINQGLAAKAHRDVMRKIQMIFQDPAASLNERATIDYIISEGLLNFHLYHSEQDRREQVARMIKAVGLLPEHLSRYPHEFSGGQRQRIGIARALIMRPELVVADEPISALDVSIRAQILNLLKQFQQESQLSYLFIAHDLSVVRFISDRVAVIHNGRILELAPTAELFAHPLHPYTQSLLAAIPIPDPQLARQKQLVAYHEVVHEDPADAPRFSEVVPGHFIYATQTELAAYRTQLAVMRS